MRNNEGERREWKEMERMERKETWERPEKDYMKGIYLIPPIFKVFFMYLF